VRELQATLGALRRSLEPANGHPPPPALAALGKAVDRLAGQLRLLPFAATGERPRTIDVTAELTAFAASVEPLLRRDGVRLDLKHPARQVVRVEMAPEQLHCLLHILTANAVDWLGQVEERRIRVTVSADVDTCTVLFKDTGPGIPIPIGERVFEPGFSTREGARGMGLTIARRLVEDHGGRIRVLLDGRRRGANVEFTLPRKRSRATFYSGR
jgi:signal transduction histidine kinase